MSKPYATTRAIWEAATRMQMAKENITLRGLARTVGRIHHSTASFHLDRLEARGYIRRLSHQKHGLEVVVPFMTMEWQAP